MDMSAACVRGLFYHAVRTTCRNSSCSRTPAARFPLFSEGWDISASSRKWSPFSTAIDDTQETPAPTKKKQDPRSRVTISSVGRKIPHRQLQVISEAGENLGVMHRADVIRIMDERGLKLVVLSEHKDPPVYRMMSGRQIHEEQMKMWEKQKSKAAPVQVKELTFSSGIAAHDLTNKLKQVENWLEKKHHVRITLRSSRREPTENLDTNLEQMVQQMEVTVGFVSKPRVIRDGQAAMCILRPPSAKELSKKEKSPTSLPGLQPTEDGTPPAGNTETTQGNLQP